MNNSLEKENIGKKREYKECRVLKFVETCHRRTNPIRLPIVTCCNYVLLFVADVRVGDINCMSLVMLFGYCAYKL